MHSFKGWQNNKNHAFRSKRCASNDKMCYCYTLTTKIIRTYLYITCNKIIFLLKNILAYYGYSPISPFLLLLSEHKHCDKAATNSNSENARSRMVASLRGILGTGRKEDESSNGRVWAAGFHHVTARSRLARVFKLINRLFI